MAPNLCHTKRAGFLSIILFLVCSYYIGSYFVDYDPTAPYSFDKPKLRLSTRPKLVGYSSKRGAKTQSGRSFDKEDYIYILYWTEWFSAPWPNTTFNNCHPTTKCRTVYDRRYLNRSSALIFHARDISHTDLPPVKYLRQKYVFYSLESPVLTFAALHGAMRTFFDWAMTYRTDSHIYCPYNYFTRKNRSDVVIDHETSLMIQEVTNRRRSVLWIVSNCDAHSLRARYVYELQKYVQVDIFGDCGRPCHESPTGNCSTELLQQYKFYISFENAVCPDYISEKFAGRMSHGLVPIVLKREDYDRMVAWDDERPSGWHTSDPHEDPHIANRSEYWFIAADDFKSPKHLADYLVYLGEYPTEYAKYHGWRKKWQIGSSVGRYCECDLCARLHEDREKWRELVRNGNHDGMEALSKEEEKHNVKFDIFEYWKESKCDRAYASKLLERGESRRIG